MRFEIILQPRKEFFSIPLNYNYDYKVLDTYFSGIQNCRKNPGPVLVSESYEVENDNMIIEE